MNLEYFVKRKSAAEEKYTQFLNTSNSTRETGVFMLGGGSSKGFRNKYNNTLSKKFDLNGKLFLRISLLRLAELELRNKEGNLNWHGFMDCCSDLNIAKYPIDNYDYHSLTFFGSGHYGAYLEAFRNFIEIHGSSLDKKYLLPKFTIAPTPQPKSNQQLTLNY